MNLLRVRGSSLSPGVSSVAARDPKLLLHTHLCLDLTLHTHLCLNYHYTHTFAWVTPWRGAAAGGGPSLRAVPGARARPLDWNSATCQGGRAPRVGTSSVGKSNVGTSAAVCTAIVLAAIARCYKPGPLFPPHTCTAHAPFLPVVCTVMVLAAVARHRWPAAPTRGAHGAQSAEQTQTLVQQQHHQQRQQQQHWP